MSDTPLFHKNTEGRNTSNTYSGRRPRVYAWQWLARGLFALTLRACFVIVVGLLAGGVGFLVFFRPTPVVSAPDMVGKPLVDAVLLLQDKQLYPSIALQYTQDPLDKGKVIKQNPVPGMPIRSGREVSITVSQGTVIAQIPDYRGMTYNKALDEINAQFSGLSSLLQVASVKKIFQSDVPPGVIVAQDPPVGSKISGKDTKISFVISRGTNAIALLAERQGTAGERSESAEQSQLSEQTTEQRIKTMVPDVTGLSFNKAYDVLSAVKIPIEFYISDRNVELPSEYGVSVRKAGMVVEQLPTEGASLKTLHDNNAVFRVGIRRANIYASLKDASSDDNVKSSAYEAGVLSITLPRYSTPRTILITRKQNSGAQARNVFSFVTRGGQVTVPYFVIPGVQYEAVLSDTVVWRYTVPGADG